MNTFTTIAIISCLAAFLFIQHTNGASVSKPENKNSEVTTDASEATSMATYDFDVMRICKAFCKWNPLKQAYRGNCNKTKFRRACKICRNDIGCAKINSGGLMG